MRVGKFAYIGIVSRGVTNVAWCIAQQNFLPLLMIY